RAPLAGPRPPPRPACGGGPDRGGRPCGDLPRGRGRGGADAPAARPGPGLNASVGRPPLRALLTIVGALALLLLLPDAAFAFGPATHVFLGTHLLDALHLLPETLASLLRMH